jgi:hemolysin III
MERQPNTDAPGDNENLKAEPEHKGDRLLSFGEEVANSISHGFGLLLAIVAVPILVVAAVRVGRAQFVVGVSVFGASMIVLYLASTLYHSLSHGPAKRVARAFDHSAIFLLIAGSYTPFTLGVLRGPWGWSLLGIVWGLAAIGLTMKAVSKMRYQWVSMVLYLAMGWLVVVAIKPVLALVPLPGILLIAAGGVAYTGGLGFFAAQRLRYHHFIWHLFVIAGTTCHFFAVLWYGA